MHPIIHHYLQHFYFHHYTVSIRVNKPVTFSYFPGDTIRDCFLFACSKIQIQFKDKKIALADVFSKEAHYPIGSTPPLQEDRKAIAIDVENIQQRTYHTNEIISFNLIVFGQANDGIDHIILALQKMQLRNANHKLVNVELVAVQENHPKQIANYLFKQNTNTKPILKYPITIHDFKHTTDVVTQLNIHYMTPTAFDKSGIYTGNYALSTMVRKTLHRMLALTLLYCRTEFDFEYAVNEMDQFIKEADFDCKIKELHLKWEKYELPKKQIISGVVGTVSYHDGTIKYIPVLEMLPWLLTGNKTMYGCGKIKMDYAY